MADIRTKISEQDIIIRFPGTLFIFSEYPSVCLCVWYHFWIKQNKNIFILLPKSCQINYTYPFNCFRKYISYLYFLVWIAAERRLAAISTDLLNPCSGSPQPVSPEQQPDIPQIPISAPGLQIFSNMRTSRDILLSTINTHSVTF